ncbi:MAG: VOC family protein [Planctomycetota bacterium]
MTPPPLLGLHHVTAIAGPPQRNLDFYTRTLGLRLVKVTVNFDDPGAYHFYFGDDAGRPGTLTTFFPWPDARDGVIGLPQSVATCFGLPNLPDGERVTRFDDEVVTFTDPDGTRLEALHADTPKLHSATLCVEGSTKTAALLTGPMGLTLHGEDAGRQRFIAGDGSAVDLMCTPGAQAGRLGAGVVHHVAFRTESADTQKQWHAYLTDAGFNISPVMDRDYFTSIYFREPGGVLFEIATDGPGFGVDEDEPGTALKLPTMYEPHRAKIEAALPKIVLPGGSTLP